MKFILFALLTFAPFTFACEDELTPPTSLEQVFENDYMKVWSTKNRASFEVFKKIREKPELKAIYEQIKKLSEEEQTAKQNAAQSPEVLKAWAKELNATEANLAEYVSIKNEYDSFRVVKDYEALKVLGAQHLLLSPIKTVTENGLPTVLPGQKRVVLYSTPQCTPCTEMLPIFAQLSHFLGPKVDVFYVNERSVAYNNGVGFFPSIVIESADKKLMPLDFRMQQSAQAIWDILQGGLLALDNPEVGTGVLEWSKQGTWDFFPLEAGEELKHANARRMKVRYGIEIRF